MAYAKHSTMCWWDMTAPPCQNKWDVYNTGCQNYDSESDHSSVLLIDSGSASACLTGLSGLSQAPHAIPGRGVRQSRRDRRSGRFQLYGSLPLHYPCSPLISSHSRTMAPGQLKCEVLREHTALLPCHHEQVRHIYPEALFFYPNNKAKVMNSTLWWHWNISYTVHKPYTVESGNQTIKLRNCRSGGNVSVFNILDRLINNHFNDTFYYI